MLGTILITILFLCLWVPCRNGRIAEVGDFIRAQEWD
jgi:hypothetical protein